MSQDVFLTGKERFFNDTEIIVSKTNLKGHITYANTIFLDIAGYTEAEIIGKPHSIIRHPDMPRCIFKMLWDTLFEGHEIFAYVLNRCKNGDHYWVYAHVTPSFNMKGDIIGFHSNRRVPERHIIEQVITPLYKNLKQAEQQEQNRKDGLLKSCDLVTAMLADKGMPYEEFIMTIGKEH